MSASLTGKAMQNPVFQQAAMNVAFQHVQQEEGDNELFNKNAKSTVDPAALDVDEKELGRIRFWARNLRIALFIVGIFMGVCGFENLGSTTSSSLSTIFLALYLLFFSCIICCFALGLKRFTTFVVQNFGFMYSGIGKGVFLIFIGFICYDLAGIWGYLAFSLLIVYGFANCFVHWKHPQYHKYLKLTHYYQRTVAKRPTPAEPVANHV